MVRAPFVDENGLKKGAWSVEEDNKLRSYIQRYGHWNWRELPKFAGLARCGKSCRLRWMNYLQPNVKHGSYTEEEEDLIIKLHQQLGNRWSKIAKSLPGRTDNEVKNYWHTHLKKRVLHHQTTTNKIRKRTLTKKSPSPSQAHKMSQVDNDDNNNMRSRLKFSQTNNLHILESCPLSPQRTHSTVETCKNFNSETLSTLTEDQYHHNIVGDHTKLEQTFSHGCFNNIDNTQTIWNSMGEDKLEQIFSDGGSNNIDNTQAWNSMVEEVLDTPFWTEPFFLDTYVQYNDDANSNLVHELFSSPTSTSSYWEMMDFSCIFETDVNMQCMNEVETNYW